MADKSLTVQSVKLSSNMPGLISLFFMTGFAFLGYFSGKRIGNNQIVKPQFLVGAGAKNFGIYPMAELFIGAGFLLVTYWKLIYNQIREKRSAKQSFASKSSPDPDDQALLNSAASQIQVQLKEGESYYSAKNWMCLHLPRILLNSLVIGLMAGMPWAHDAMDNGVRLHYEDPNSGEAAAAEGGKWLFGVITTLMFFTASILIPLINSQVYVLEKDADSKVQLSDRKRCLFVDHSREFKVISQMANPIL